MNKETWFYINDHEYRDIDSSKLEGSVYEVGTTVGWPEAIHYEIFKLGDYNWIDQMRIQKGDVVVDVGANIGIFSRFAHLNGASRVLSFEMDDKYYRVLEKNNSDFGLESYHVGVGSKSEVVKYASTDHFGGSTIHIEGKPEEIIKKVNFMTLSGVIAEKKVDRIDYLKIDVEGAEFDVIAGIKDEDYSKIRKIAMEYHNSFFGYDAEKRQSMIENFTNRGYNYFLLWLGNNEALQMLYFYK